MNSPRLLRSRFARAAVLLAALGTVAPPSAFGWGQIGHRAAGRVSESLLNPTALANVHSLLEPGETLADAATWADEVRRDRPETATWHYVNVPIERESYDDSFCDLKKGCVVSIVEVMKARVADAKLPISERREALRFLVHCLQDLHQPVHVGDNGDRGGNDLQVQFFNKGSNLHRVWDFEILERAEPDEQAWTRHLKEYATPERIAEWSEGTVEDWADESLQAAKLAYQDPETGALLKPGAKLGRAYQEANFPTAERRLAQSAVRVAAVLNAAFPEPE